MKRISLVAALLGTIVLAFAGVAMAATPTTTNLGTPGNVNAGGGTGKGTVVTHYVATYTDPFFGSVQCIGVNQVTKAKQMQDSFTCTSTQGGLTNVTPNEPLTLSTISGWISDFDGSTYAKTFTGTVSADGMSYSAVATY
jgi:hypothetical protein